MTIVACSVDGCEKKQHSRGFCANHYAERRRQGLLESFADKRCDICENLFTPVSSVNKYCSSACKRQADRSRKKDTPPACSIEDCGRPSTARNLCGKHYRRLMARLNPCSYKGCKNGKAYEATGFCKTHQDRLRKHGDPSITMKGKAHKVQYTEEGLRICSRCEVPQPDENFHRDKGGSNGRRAACKKCETKIERERYLKNADRIKEAERQRRIANGPAIRKREKARYERDRDKRIELATKQSHIRRARLAQVQSDPGLTRLALRKRDGDLCYYCKREMDFSRAVGRKFKGTHATIEHLVAISSGGTHTFDNCVLACRDCNLTKNDKPLEDFLGFKILDENESGQSAMFDLIA